MPSDQAQTEASWSTAGWHPLDKRALRLAEGVIGITRVLAPRIPSPTLQLLAHKLCRPRVARLYRGK